ncbi:unnamed protein product [Musa hybrid cultivar]
MASSFSSPPRVVDECRGVLRVLSDGAIVRSQNPSFPIPVVDDGSVEWKDALFSPAPHALNLRLYRPRRSQTPGEGRLPVFFYFHGGGFCIGSRTWPNCQNYCLRLASDLRALCPDDAFLNRELNDRYWRLSIPSGATLDHPLVNPLGPESADLEAAEVDPILVVVGGRDLLRDRAAEYAARLRGWGKPVELAEFEGQQHGFFTIDPWSEPSGELMGAIKRFMKDNGGARAFVRFDRMQRNKTPPPAPQPPSPGAGVSAAQVRRQPLIRKQPTRPGPRCAELAGVTAADCAAVCCCGPCMVVNLVVLTAVKLPARVCRRVLQARDKRKERARKRKEARLLGPMSDAGGDRLSTVTTEDLNGDVEGLHGFVVSAAGPSPAEVAEVEKEILARFQRTGFWRSPSRSESQRRLERYP